MRTIVLDAVLPDPPSYDSPARAIAADRMSQRRLRSERDSGLIKGSSISRVLWSDRRAVVELAGGRSLEIIAVEHRVDWHVGKWLEERPSQLEEVSRYAECLLILPDGARMTWRPVDLFSARLGATVTGLFAGEAYLNLYFDGAGVLQFSAIRADSNRLMLLHASELEPDRRM